MSEATPSSTGADRLPSPETAAVARHLQELLGAQVRRLRSRYLWHGLSVCVLLPAAAILLFFALDHTLRLPLPVRLFHTAATAALLAYAAVRFVRYPLSRRFADLDTAQLLERSFPELHQRLVSTVQLQAADGAALRNQSRAMIDQLLADTAAAARTLPLDRLFDNRRTQRMFAGAAGLVLVLGLGTVLAPATARAFLLRHLGLRAEYPRETTLVVELPAAGPELQRQDTGAETVLLLPAGADLHVSVLAEGTVPKDVYLDVRSLRDEKAAQPGTPETLERSIPMTQRPGNRFRYVFRRLSGSFEFHARGGDDEHGDRHVVVRTVHPPQVASIVASIQPPAYTGVERIEQKGGAIEALAGSKVELLVTTTAAVQKASMAFLESGRRIELQPTTIQDDSAVATVHRCQFTLEGSDRYQIDLFGGTGLRNPNPGTYPIVALQDYAPVGRWLLPDDEALLLLPEALLCVRLDTHDDFGLRAVDLAVERAGARTLQKSLLPADSPPVAGAVLTEILEVRDLLGQTPAGNDGLALQLVLRDNRLPEAGTTELPRRLVQIVDAPQLAAAIARSFRGLREEVEQALGIQTDRRTRLEDLAAREGAAPADFSQVLTGVEVGQSRITSTSDRLHRGLMRAFDQHLWNRLEQSQHAAQVVDLYRAFSRDLRQPVAQAPEFYRDLQQRRTAGTLGAMETTLDPILAMIGIADRLVTTDGPEAMRLLAEAQIARAGAERQALLQATLQVQERIQKALELLLLRLEEWNDYQDLIQEARALRDRQRDLQTRTEEAKGKQ